jgi:hypothetical protein
MRCWGGVIKKSLLFVISICGLCLLDACGGGGVTIPPNPTPNIVALSPNSSEQGGQGFTLSVVGSNFVPGASIHWNGSGLPTQFVNTLLVTAEVPASQLTAPGPDAITVVNPTPGGGASNSLSLAVPCVIALTVLGSSLATCALLTLLSEEGEVAPSGYWVDGFLGDSYETEPKGPNERCRCRNQLGLGDSAPPPFISP